MVTAFAILAMFLCVFGTPYCPSIHHISSGFSQDKTILILSDRHFAIKVFLRAGVSLKLPGITYIYFSGWGIFLDFRWYFLSLLLVSTNQSIWLHTPLNFASYLWSKTEEKNSDIWTNSDNLRRGKPLLWQRFPQVHIGPDYTYMMLLQKMLYYWKYNCFRCSVVMAKSQVIMLGVWKSLIKKYKISI